MSKILLVEDDEHIRNLLTIRLRHGGYAVAVAADGQQALDSIARQPFDLVLLDIMMPGIDGLETLRIIRQTHAPTDLPVIMSTALDHSEHVVKALKLGANDYIAKPHDLSVVLARINTQLTLCRLHRELRARYDADERELDIVASVQRSLLPERLPKIDGLELASYYHTSRHAGGDYYDIIELADDKWGFLIADVSGHGPASAVLMAMTCAFFHAQPGSATDPAEVIDHLNVHVGRFAEGMGHMFVTALYCVYDAGRRSLCISRAGHVQPLVRRAATDEVVELRCQTVTPLGLGRSQRAQSVEYHLGPGDGFLLYTDGITDRVGPGRKRYGLERLRDRMAHADGADPRRTLDAIVQDVSAFADGRPSDDDEALLLGVVE